jgi:hypothetical protein
MVPGDFIERHLAFNKTVRNELADEVVNHVRYSFSRRCLRACSNGVKGQLRVGLRVAWAPIDFPALCDAYRRQSGVKLQQKFGPSSI